MHNLEDSLQVNVSNLLHTVRRLRSKTQQDVADFIRISQSNYSKMERGILTPSAKEWALFCIFTDIPIGSILRGFVDNLDDFQTSDQSLGLLKFPKHYLQDSSLLVRTLRPLINFGDSKCGPIDFHEKLEKECDLDPGFFIKMNHKCNIKLLVDIASYIQDKTGATLAEILHSSFQSEQVHGDLHQAYLAAPNSLKAIELFIEYSLKYDRYYDRQILTKDTNSLSISFNPYQLSRQDPFSNNKIYKDFMAEYSLEFIKAIGQYGKEKNQLNFTTTPTTGESFTLHIECA